MPFDMPESETDLVGGFHTEYGSFKFGIFFVAEYAHIVVGSAIFTAIFLGGWHFLPWIADPWPMTWVGTLLGIGWFLAKTVFLIFFFIWIRWTLPRFRYDQVMNLGLDETSSLGLDQHDCLRYSHGVGLIKYLRNPLTNHGQNSSS